MRTLGLALALGITPALAAPITYTLPAGPAELAPGPDRNLAQGVCGACHSLDYITTQPRPLPDPHAFWTTEVAKMRNLYGAPIGEDDAKRIADYLATTYGK